MLRVLGYIEERNRNGKEERRESRGKERKEDKKRKEKRGQGQMAGDGRVNERTSFSLNA